jgi:hypothetical protein
VRAHVGLLPVRVDITAELDSSAAVPVLVDERFESR